MKITSVSVLLGVPVLLLSAVSQHALALRVEVNEGAESVWLPCWFSAVVSEDDPTVMWTRSDLDPKSVHLLRKGGDDLRGQNQHYSGRTSMSSDALRTSDFGLTLRDPQLTDSGNYTCSINDGRGERRLTDIQLEVTDQQVEVKVEEGSESVILPCKTTPDLPAAIGVHWTRSDPEFMVVHLYYDSSDQLKYQDGFYRNRTKMNEDLLRTGDLSLTLKQPTQRDTGGYICTTYRSGYIRTQKVVLQVKGLSLPRNSSCSTPPHPPGVSVLRLFCHLVVFCPYCISTGLLLSICCSRKTPNRPGMSVEMTQRDGGVQALDEECDDITADVTTEHAF